MADTSNGSGKSGLRFDGTVGLGSVLNLLVIVGSVSLVIWQAGGQFSKLEATVAGLNQKIESAARELGQKIDLTTRRLDQTDRAHDSAIGRLERAYERSRTRGLEP